MYANKEQSNPTHHLPKIRTDICRYYSKSKWSLNSSKLIKKESESLKKRSRAQLAVGKKAYLCLEKEKMYAGNLGEQVATRRRNILEEFQALTAVVLL